jgi:catechol 2,3-dioxygenase-like lactoylglutathione lyase family enzyme
MFDHVGFGVTDYAASKAFFLKALQPLGVTVVMEGPHGVGMGQGGKPSLWMYQSDEKPAAFVIGPDGHNVEAVCHKPQA